MIGSTAMADLLLWYAAGSCIFVSPITLLAWWIQTQLGRPLVAHLLWLVVLVKLVTPTLMSIPVTTPPPVDSAVLNGSSQASVSSALPLSWDAVALSIWLARSASIAVWSLSASRVSIAC